MGFQEFLDQEKVTDLTDTKNSIENKIREVSERKDNQELNNQVLQSLIPIQQELTQKLSNTNMFIKTDDLLSNSHGKFSTLWKPDK